MFERLNSCILCDSFFFHSSNFEYEMIGNIVCISTGCWLYSFTSGGSVTEIRIKSCREARAQLYDGYAANKTGK